MMGVKSAWDGSHSMKGVLLVARNSSWNDQDELVQQSRTCCCQEFRNSLEPSYKQ